MNNTKTNYKLFPEFQMALFDFMGTIGNVYEETDLKLSDRADFFLKKYNTLIEIEGGIWNQGRHTRGFGYSNDVRKYNDFILAGYKLIRFTSDDFMAITKYEYYIKDYIKMTIEKITGETYANRTL